MNERSGQQTEGSEIRGAKQQPVDTERSETRTRLADGVYVKGAVNGEPVVFTADTGASRTVVSSRIFQKIPAKDRPSIKGTVGLVGAGGTTITERGKAVVDLTIGAVRVRKEVVIAEIEDEALLGYDVLKGGTSGPADILLSSNKIVLDGKEIPVFQVGRNRKTRRVTVAADVEIPGKAEAVVSVFVERFTGDDDSQEVDYVIDPTENFMETYPLQMAGTLVNINESPTCKVRILNPFPDGVVIKQDALIGKAEHIDRVVSVIVEAEDTEEDSFDAIRRVQIRENKFEETERDLFKARADEVPEHLKSLFQKSAEGKTESEKGVIAGLLVKHSNTFSKSDWDLGVTNLAEHSIDTGDARPIKQRPRRVPLAYADEEKKALDDLMQKGVIKKSTSPWASPIVLVRKKSGAIRPCVDYRKLNALVKPDGFPIPRIQDCLDAVAGSILFSSLDMTSGYFQIPLKEEDQPKSAFCCKYGHYEMTRMPFGLNNSSGTFQRTMELALQGLQWVTCLVYIDDIVVYGKNFEEHVQRVEEVLSRIGKAGLKLKPAKCDLLRERVVFLGHVVSKEGVSPDPSNVDKIANWPRPETAKHVKQFVATGSYYRRFVQGFAKIARPLIDLTKKDAVFKWSEECEKAFNTIKEKLIGPEVMGYPLNDGGCFCLDTDASGLGIGGVLSQEQAGKEVVLAYASRAMNKAERNYCITEQELLAVVYFMQYFRQYLLGRRFVVRSDHQALVWLFSLKEPSGKIARWLEILAPYNFSIEYRAGKKMGHVDGLSRCPNPKECSCHDVDMAEPLKCGPCAKCIRRAELMALHSPGRMETKDTDQGQPQRVDDGQLPEEIRAAKETKGNQAWLRVDTPEELTRKQMKDPNMTTLLRAKQNNERPEKVEMETESPEARHYWIIWDDIHLRDGVLYRQFQKSNQTGSYEQLLIPKEMRKEVLHQAHDSLLAGHLGVKKTKSRLMQRAYWFNSKEDVRWHVTRCDLCAADKPPQKAPKAPMGHLKSGAPWDTLALDFMGPFPETERGNRYILVMTDPFTKYVEVMATPNQKSEECAKRILNDFVARWGTPLRIHSDQGPTFESRVFTELCQLLEVRKTRTSPRNPKGNGQTERFNRTLLKMIKAYLADEQEDWDQFLGCLAGAYRSTPNETTTLTPNLLAIGREIRLPADLVYRTSESADPATGCDYVQQLKDHMHLAHEVARKYLKNGARRSKEIYDTKVVLHNYQSGDLVWCLHEVRKVGITPKLEKRYSGPYVVKERTSAVNFIIQTDRKGSTKLLHHDKLKRYEGENPPHWANIVIERMKKQRKKQDQKKQSQSGVKRKQSE